MHHLLLSIVCSESRKHSNSSNVRGASVQGMSIVYFPCNKKLIKNVSLYRAVEISIAMGLLPKMKMGMTNIAVGVPKAV